MPKDTGDIREQIAKTMMNGWLESMQDGVLHIDGGESPITKTYVNPKVLDKLEALYHSYKQQVLDELEGQLPEKLSTHSFKMPQWIAELLTTEQRLGDDEMLKDVADLVREVEKYTLAQVHQVIAEMKEFKQ